MERSTEQEHLRKFRTQVNPNVIIPCLLDLLTKEQTFGDPQGMYPLFSWGYSSHQDNVFALMRFTVEEMLAICQGLGEVTYTKPRKPNTCK